MVPVCHLPGIHPVYSRLYSQRGVCCGKVQQVVLRLLAFSCVECQTTECQRKDRIRKIVKDHAGLGLDFERVDYSTDLYRAGMTSYASVVLMIALENEFELEFPDAMLSRSVFES